LFPVVSSPFTDKIIALLYTASLFWRRSGDGRDSGSLNAQQFVTISANETGLPAMTGVNSSRERNPGWFHRPAQALPSADPRSADVVEQTEVPAEVAALLRNFT
jgi:hypothetical protein